MCLSQATAEGRAAAIENRWGGGGFANFPCLTQWCVSGSGYCTRQSSCDREQTGGGGVANFPFLTQWCVSGSGYCTRQSSCSCWICEAAPTSTQTPFYRCRSWTWSSCTCRRAASPATATLSLPCSWWWELQFRDWTWWDACSGSLLWIHRDLVGHHWLTTRKLDM